MSSVAYSSTFHLACLFLKRPNYDTWLNQIVASYQTLLDGKDRTFSRFLLDLPTVPADVLDLLRDLCVDSTRYLLSFSNCGLWLTTLNQSR